MKLIKTLLRARKEQPHGHSIDSERQEYILALLKPGHLYKPCESFGELALITDKRRAAKLEVTDDCDAHFAILSKKDFRTALYKIQLAGLQDNIKFLK